MHEEYLNGRIHACFSNLSKKKISSYRPAKSSEVKLRDGRDGGECVV